MGYEVFDELCKKRGIRPFHVSKATGISTATLTAWKKGDYTPKADKLQLIADYFGVSRAFIENAANTQFSAYLRHKLQFLE